jgi:hypothetical protein
MLRFVLLLPALAVLVCACAAKSDPDKWTRFPPTVEEFARYFDSRADSLHPLEGIWSSRVERSGFDERYFGFPTYTVWRAVVRDTSVTPKEFVAVETDWERRHEEGWPIGRLSYRFRQLGYDSTSETTLFEVRSRNGDRALGEAQLQWNLLKFPASWRSEWFKEYPREGPFSRGRR